MISGGIEVKFIHSNSPNIRKEIWRRSLSSFKIQIFNRKQLWESFFNVAVSSECVHSKRCTLFNKDAETQSSLILFLYLLHGYSFVAIIIRDTNEVIVENLTAREPRITSSAPVFFVIVRTNMMQVWTLHYKHPQRREFWFEGWHL